MYFEFRKILLDINKSDKPLSEYSSLILGILAMIGLGQLAVYGQAAGVAGPEFLQAMNHAPLEAYWSPSFLACVMLFILMVYQVLMWTIIVQGCTASLQKRMFG
jgi:hypothetical protein